MAEQDAERRIYRNLPLYSPGAAPRYMFTESQLREQFDLRPGAPCRALVGSQYGPGGPVPDHDAKMVDSQFD
jgi:hypothetical protein